MKYYYIFELSTLHFFLNFKAALCRLILGIAYRKFENNMKITYACAGV